MSKVWGEVRRSMKVSGAQKVGEMATFEEWGLRGLGLKGLRDMDVEAAEPRSITFRVLVEGE